VFAVSAISPENSVTLFPSLACRDGQVPAWKVLIQGDVFTTSEHIGLTKRLLLRFLQRLLKATDEMLQSEIFRDRIGRFLARDERGKSVQVRIGGEIYTVPSKTGPTGHFAGVIRVPEDTFSPHDPSPQQMASQARVQIALQDGDERHVSGNVSLLPAEGISVISDIDDTVKHSHVGCRRTLLQNTFLKEFEVVEGMATVYQRWAKQGAAFHYVSSSPWHLYQQLSTLLHVASFPAGSYHLRSFRLRDHFLRRLLMLRRSGKGTIITSLLRLMPQRHFVLVGDSGEADPEIYGAIARRFPDQVRKIFIRELPGPKSNFRRFTRAFRQVPAEKWQLYRRAEELGDLPIEELMGSGR